MIRRIAFSLAGLVLLLAAGCLDSGSQGAAGRLSFLDTTPTVGNLDRKLDRPLATGAEVRVKVREAIYPYIPVKLRDAASSDPSVFEVSEVSGSLVRLEGVSTGSAVLEVMTDGGVTDMLPIRVARIAETTLLVEGSEAPEAVFLPGHEIGIFAVHRGPDGRILTGFGAASFIVEARHATFERSDRSEGVVITAGEAPEVIGVATDTGASTTVETVTRAAVDRIALTWRDGTPIGTEPIELESGDEVGLYVSAWLADGRLVVGRARGEVEVTLEADDPDVLGINEDPLDPSREIAISDGGRYLLAVAGTPGDARVTTRWAGGEASARIRVVPAPEEE